ncbi:MAG: type II secretion system F family protein, partial [Parasporobacterium sp.]|nr:type II secretion system F family protein [Parasporobacterium sp.]
MVSDRKDRTLAAYKYQAISKDGAKVNGVIEAFSEVEAVSRIKQTCNVVLKIQEINEEKTSILALEIDGNKLNAKAFTVMCSQFAIILKAGIRVSRAVQLVADKT